MNDVGILKGRLGTREPVAVQAAVIDPFLEVDPHGAQRRQGAALIEPRIDVVGADFAHSLFHGRLLQSACGRAD